MPTKYAGLMDETIIVAKENGKLLFIQKMSNWLLDQPETLSKENILNYLINEVAEDVEPEIQ